jgi:butyrate kinase
MKILVLNLGSTSTKFGVFEGPVQLRTQTIRHSKQELAPYSDVLEQKNFRKKKVEEWLLAEGFHFSDFAAIAARGGLLRPTSGGAYRIDEEVVRDAASGLYGMHPANVGLLIAFEWSRRHHLPALFSDAPSTDELSDLARISGFAGTSRRSVFHALNAKRVIRLFCRERELKPETGRFIVAHMGGGITVSAVDGLRAVDINNGVDGEGPFTPERAGSLPTKAVLGLVEKFRGDINLVYETLYHSGGLMSYFGSNDVEELSRRAEEEPEVRLVLDAMLYQIAKQIGAMAAALGGKVDHILLTGGIAHNQAMMERLTARVGWIAPCAVYPGEDELAALAEAAYRCLLGEETAKTFGG